MNGYIGIHKPIGVSSSKITIACRNALSHALGHKVTCGHMGTLDPEAEGVLVVAFGKAPRLFDVLAQSPKGYRASLVLGQQTDTLDRAGQVIATASLPLWTDVQKAIGKWIGAQMQIPPAYSAIHCNGVRAYALAREGVEVELAPRPVQIDSIVPFDPVIREDGSCECVGLDIVCGSGTYIRSLCRDIAIDASSVGYMDALCRTQCSGVSLSECISVEQWQLDPLGHIRPIESLLQGRMPFLTPSEENARKLRNGIRADFGWQDGLSLAWIEDKPYCVCKTEQGITRNYIHLWEENN